MNVIGTLPRFFVSKSLLRWPLPLSNYKCRQNKCTAIRRAGVLLRLKGMETGLTQDKRS